MGTRCRRLTPAVDLLAVVASFLTILPRPMSEILADSDLLRRMLGDFMSRCRICGHRAVHQCNI
jgi:hypothetical protein